MSRTLSLAALTALTASALFQDPHDKTMPIAELIGRPFAAALARLGPPDIGVGTASLVRWYWNDPAGGRLSIAMHAGLVVEVDEHFCRAAVVPRATPAKGTYPGQPIDELFTRLGAPQRVQPAPIPRPGGPLEPAVSAEVRFVYPEQPLLVSAGFVLGPEPAVPAASGPR